MPDAGVYMHARTSHAPPGAIRVRAGDASRAWRGAGCARARACRLGSRARAQGRSALSGPK